MIRAVCFDMDGVLTDTERMGLPVMQEAAARQRYLMTEDQWRTLLGTTMEDTGRALTTYYPGIDLPRFMQDWYDLTMARIRREGLPKKPGADAILQTLRKRGLKLALCTSNGAQVVAEYMEIAGWAKAFDVIVTGNLVVRGKPDPEIYLQAAERMGVKPEECIGVEDSPRGLQAVRAAGMYSVMIPDMQPWSEALIPLIDARLERLEELEGLL